MISKTEAHTAYCLECGLLDAIQRYLAHQKVGIRKQAYWLLGNIAIEGAGKALEVLASGLVPLGILWP